VNNLIQAKLHLMLLLTLKGTPFLYNGEEIGMSDFMIDDPNLFRDPLGNLYYELEKKVMGANEEKATREGAKRGRDRNRTPMQWSNGANAGFCPPGVKPWLPVNPDYSKGINVAQQQEDPDTLFYFYRKLLHLRQENPALQLGEYNEIICGNEEVLSYTRTGEKQGFLIILNLSDHQQKAQFKSLPKIDAVITNTKENLVRNGTEIMLQPYQGLIFSTM
jgi:alpha-glucosidase